MCLLCIRSPVTFLYLRIFPIVINVSVARRFGSGSTLSPTPSASSFAASSGSGIHKKPLLHSISIDRASSSRTMLKDSQSTPTSVDVRSSADDLNSDDLSLTRADWNLLLGGFMGVKSLSFARGEVVMKEGSHYHRIYQIARGSCRIEQSRKDTGGPGLTNSAPEETAAAAGMHIHYAHIEIFFFLQSA